MRINGISCNFLCSSVNFIFSELPEKSQLQEKHCYAVVIDPIEERVFYVASLIQTQRRGSSIHSASLDGSDQKLVLSSGLAKV